MPRKIEIARKPPPVDIQLPPPQQPSVKLRSPTTSPSSAFMVPPSTPPKKQPLKPQPPRPQPIVVPSVPQQAKDDTLAELMNPNRVHPETTAMTSPIRQQQQQMMYDDNQYDDGPDDGQYYDGPDDGQYDDGQYDDGPYDDELAQPGQPMPPGPFDAQQAPRPLSIEDEALQKAKYLVRMEQLKDRGIKPDKNYDVKSSLQDLKMGALRMEVIDMRQKRIEQGRSALLMTVSGIEMGCNYLDDNSYLGNFKLHMRGFNNHVFDDITMYDDCLEKGVEEILGPMENRKWYTELARMLFASMVMYSYTNRRNHSSTVKAVAEELKKDDDFMKSVKDEIRKENTAASEPQEEITLKPPPRARPASLLDEFDPNAKDTQIMMKEKPQTQTV
jgi:hypothetical protein